VAELRARQFYAGVVTGTTAHDIATVPAGKIWIIKSVSIQNFNTTAADIQIKATAALTLVRIHIAAYGSSGDYSEWRPWIVLVAGDVINVQRLQAGQNSIVISGSQHYV
jgi:hypothetical protein